jgi:hypothetical protein
MVGLMVAREKFTPGEVSTNCQAASSASFLLPLFNLLANRQEF